MHNYRYTQVLSTMEVPPRFELGSGAFAELCLTTWLWHHFVQGMRLRGRILPREKTGQSFFAPFWSE